MISGSVLSRVGLLASVSLLAAACGPIQPTVRSDQTGTALQHLIGNVRTLVEHTTAGTSATGQADRSTEDWSATYGTNAPTTDWEAGRVQTYTVHLSNTGTQAWVPDGANPVHLGIYFGPVGDSDPDHALRDLRVSLASTIEPGQSADVSVVVPAPPGPGTFSLSHRLVVEGQAWFPRPLVQQVRVSPPPQAAAYFAEPNQTWPQGAPQAMAITLLNIGTESWPSAGNTPVHLAVSLSGDPADEATRDVVRLTLPADVPAGQSVTLRVPVPLQNRRGPVRVQARLVRENVEWFPQNLSVVECVEAPWATVGQARP